MAPVPSPASASSSTTSHLLPSSPSISAFLASHPALTLLHTQCATMAHLRQLHAALVKSGLAKDPIAASRAVAFCAGEGRDAAYAARIVRHHPRPNSFMWNTVIRALSDGPGPDAAVALVDMMLRLGALEQGAWVHAYIDKHDVAMNALVVTALVDMYCKCGSIHKARQVFDTSRSQGMAKLSSWNAMMLGLAAHGQCQEALALFSELEPYGLRPDKVTFIAMLMAYGHSGMADEAKALFASMGREYGVTPGIEHYGCLVDALARAGRLREAEDTIRAMPMKPDAAIWGALLSGCRLHGDAEAGARAARGAVECDPQDSGAYVLAASVLARDGEVGRGLGVRGKMREEGVAKVPGCSMIEVNGVVHEFVS
uniref:Pentatricopeptide repeat-containing protein n=1 Tax=Aegilops tauschii TaxID=37682 RepID=R7W8X5_AEGTA